MHRLRLRHVEAWLQLGGSRSPECWVTLLVIILHSCQMKFSIDIAPARRQTHPSEAQCRFSLECPHCLGFAGLRWGFRSGFYGGLESGVGVWDMSRMYLQSTDCRITVMLCRVSLFPLLQLRVSLVRLCVGTLQNPTKGTLTVVEVGRGMFSDWVFGDLLQLAVPFSGFADSSLIASWGSSFALGCCRFAFRNRGSLWDPCGRPGRSSALRAGYDWLPAGVHRQHGLS